MSGFLDVFKKPYYKEEKIKILEEIGFEVNEAMRMKIIYEDMILKAYKCSQGVLTIGIGCTTYEDGSKVKEGDVISLKRAIELFEFHYHKACESLNYLFYFDELEYMGEVRKNVLIDLVFNMGLAGVKKFPKMLKALREGDWEEAGEQLKDSLYYKQVGQRAVDNVQRLKEGH
jgi:lysozyme